MRAALFALACVVFTPLPGVAQSPWMTNKEMRAAFSGQTIEGVYRSGRTFKESYLADGRLSYDERSRHHTGHWSVINGTFCTIYDTSVTGGCFRVQKISANCFEFYFQTRDEAAAAEPDKHGQPTWTAQAWRTSALSTCKERPSV